MGKAEPGVSIAPHLPLKGFRILSAEQYGAGPYGTLFLAQLGAEVIKIEAPNGGDTARGVGPHFLRENESLYFHRLNFASYVKVNCYLLLIGYYRNGN